MTVADHATDATEVVINSTTDKKVISSDVYKEIWVAVDATGDGTKNEQVTLYAK